jgi:uncharacterized protein (TIGR03435 family)
MAYPNRQRNYAGVEMSRVPRAKAACALFAVALAAAGQVAAQPLVAAAPKFEVASVKPSTSCEDAGAKAGRGGAAGVSDPGRLELRCRTAMDLIRMAYVQYPDGKRKPPGRQMPVTGGPAWLDSVRYDIDAKPEFLQSLEMMRGPMMQALLEDRFQLKIHRETRDVAVYALTVAKGGPKLQIAQKETCIPAGAGDPLPPPSQRPAGMLRCGVFAPSKASDGVYMYSTTLANFCEQLSFVLDRDVIDKTGIAGVFDIHVEPPTDASTEDPSSVPAPPPAPGTRASLIDPLGSSILAAVQKAGLRLEPAKGTGEFLVIDRVERQSGN